jgi:hypothetical protein
MKRRTLEIALLPEVRQIERSAARHAREEARRLGRSAPAAALRAVAEHADRAEVSLDALVVERTAAGSLIGAALGALFSMGRNLVGDYLLNAEQSYRGTLLGLRHGYDVVVQARTAALADGDAEFAGWCDRWLTEREPLIQAVAEQMRWFVDHPARALQRAKLGSMGAARE